MFTKEHINSLKNPYIMLTWLGAIAMIVGGLMTWFTFGGPEEVAPFLGPIEEAAKEALADKHTLVLWSGVASLIGAVAATKVKGKWIQGLVFLIAGYAFIAVVAEIMDQESLEPITTTVTAGYYAALVGSAAVSLGGLLSMIKPPRMAKAKASKKK
ncbi:MAG: hypothetical protein M3P98_00345 [bacterium]|nr:hypothetical protein [bacterium]